MLGLLFVIAAHGVDVVDRPLPQSAFDRGVLSIGGVIQPRFDVYGSEDLFAPGSAAFRVRRARLAVSAGLLSDGPTLRASTSIELTPMPALLDAFVEASWTSWIGVRLGQHKAPLLRGMLVSGSSTLFPDAPMIVGWAPSREVGATVQGMAPDRVVEWAVGVFDGEGINAIANTDGKFLYAARVVVAPLGSPGHGTELYLDASEGPVFSIGATGHRNVTGAEGATVAATGVSGELFFHWSGLTAQGELLYRVVDSEPLGVLFHQLGGYVHAAMFLPDGGWAREHLAVMARYEQGDSMYGEGIFVIGPTDPTQHNRRIAIGLGYDLGAPWVRDVQDVRVVATYTLKRELETFPVDDDRFTIATSFSF